MSLEKFIKKTMEDSENTVYIDVNPHHYSKKTIIILRRVSKKHYLVWFGGREHYLKYHTCKKTNDYEKGINLLEKTISINKKLKSRGITTHINIMGKKYLWDAEEQQVKDKLREYRENKVVEHWF